MRNFCTDLSGYSSENFPAADNGCFFQPPDILDFSEPLVHDKFFESLEMDGNLHFPASDSSQPNMIGDCQAKKFCTDLPGYSPENFAAADNETSFQLPGNLDSSESPIDAKFFEELEMDGDLHFPASGSGQPNRIGNSQAKNYYRCSHVGCDVKKRVERDKEDPRFVITTYEGMHKHECPCVIYYITPQNGGEHVGFNAAQIPFVPLAAPYAGRQGFYLSNYTES